MCITSLWGEGMVKKVKEGPPNYIESERRCIDCKHGGYEYDTTVTYCRKYDGYVGLMGTCDSWEGD